VTLEDLSMSFSIVVPEADRPILRCRSDLSSRRVDIDIVNRSLMPNELLWAGVRPEAPSHDH
jgi:hypothetical protein